MVVGDGAPVGFFAFAQGAVADGGWDWRLASIDPELRVVDDEMVAGIGIDGYPGGDEGVQIC